MPIVDSSGNPVQTIVEFSESKVTTEILEGAGKASLELTRDGIGQTCSYIRKFILTNFVIESIISNRN